MLAQNEDFTNAFKSMFWHLKIRITNKCNLKCRHCYVPTENYIEEKEDLDPELLDLCLKSKHIKYVHFQGGEPTLYPERMLNYSHRCRKYNKPFCIFTNGLLLSKNKDLIKLVKEEIKPDFLCVSLNKYLLEQIPSFDIVNQLMEEFLDTPIKTFSTAIIDSSKIDVYTKFIKNDGWPPYDPNDFPELESKLNRNFFKFQLPLIAGGRGKNLENDIPYMIWPRHIIGCDFSIAVHPNGILSADCGSGDSEKDILGHITQFGDDPVEDILKRRKTNLIKTPPGHYNSFYDFCKNNNAYTCLKEYP